MAGQTSDLKWYINEYLDDYIVWERPVTGAAIYQITRRSDTGDLPPTNYAGYADKNALLHIKGLI